MEEKSSSLKIRTSSVCSSAVYSTIAVLKKIFRTSYDPAVVTSWRTRNSVKGLFTTR